jgi:hypothetical protein
MKKVVSLASPSSIIVTQSPDFAIPGGILCDRFGWITVATLSAPAPRHISVVAISGIWKVKHLGQRIHDTPAILEERWTIVQSGGPSGFMCRGLFGSIDEETSYRNAK